jgi:phage terminase large subunit GpA-like protein
MATLEDILVSAAESIQPTERLSVSQAAEKYIKINNPGSYVGPYRLSTTPYLREPLDVLNSLEYTGMAFCGPAQSGKTEMSLAWLTHTAICDPSDFAIFNPSRDIAKSFSEMRVRRLYNNSPEVGQRVMPGRHNNNKFSTRFKSGMILTMSWPTIKTVSGRSFPRIWAPDYDRVAPDIDGEGPLFELLTQRIKTFREFGMVAAESSPGFAVKNAKKAPATKHSAPEIEGNQGILPIYNRGDRRRWYWECAHCGDWFQPVVDNMQWPDSDDLVEAAERAVMICPSCGGVHTFHEDKTSPGRDHMNQNGLWVPDGCRVEDKKVVGTKERTPIASFWMEGPAAGFATWKDIIWKYLSALREYDRTKDETALKATIMTDQGKPYAPMSEKSGLLPEHLKARAVEAKVGEVPKDVRFLVASVDVQKGAFVVQVHGIASEFDIYVIDRFTINKSKRLDGAGLVEPLSPSSFGEDWQVLVDAVITKSYPIEGTESFMSIKATACDSGGEEGVTANAYTFWRWLKDKTPNLHTRFHLVKGASTPTAPRVSVTYPDSTRKDRHSGARGDVPVLKINSNIVKDQAHAMLERPSLGGAGVTFATGLDDNFYAELTAEIRTHKGWTNKKRLRNESWDLLVYCIALCLSPSVGVELIDWQSPPSWATPYEMNSLVFSETSTFIPPVKRKKLAELAAELS